MEKKLFGSKKHNGKDGSDLQYGELIFDVLSNDTDDIFVMFDGTSWKTDYVSPNVQRLLGITSEAVKENIHLIGESSVNAYDYISGEELDSIPVGGSRTFEREHINSTTGERRWYSETVYRKELNDRDKLIIVMSDRTNDKNASRDLEKTLDISKSADRANKYFLAIMSRDMRTPMNAIIGLSVLLGKDAEEPKKVREYAEKISDSCHKMLGLINDVLDISEVESGKISLNKAPFNIRRLISGIYEEISPSARKKGQSLKLHFSELLSEDLIGDKQRLSQILINLLSNAVKYTPASGKIDFYVECLLKSTEQYADFRFTVKDNGIGMSEEFLKTLFDPMERLSSPALAAVQDAGLGMVITKTLTELMGGSLKVESTLGKGSTFTVDLRFDTAVSAKGAETASMLDGMTFLLAEDNELNAEIISEMLIMEGAKCEFAENGKKALDMFTHSHKGYYDVILMDVQMPEMNGYEATRRIRASNHPSAQKVPIIAMTANAFEEDVRSALNSGMDGHLSKPIDMGALKTMILSLKK